MRSMCSLLHCSDVVSQLGMADELAQRLLLIQRFNAHRFYGDVGPAKDAGSGEESGVCGACKGRRLRQEEDMDGQVYYT